jgi:hypothetical protein
MANASGKLPPLFLQRTPISSVLTDQLDAERADDRGVIMRITKTEVHKAGARAIVAAGLVISCAFVGAPMALAAAPVASTADSTTLGPGPVLVAGGSQSEPVEEDLITLGGTQQAADFVNATQPELAPEHQNTPYATLLKYGIVGCTMMNDQPLDRPEDLSAALQAAYGFDHDEVVALLSNASASMCPQDDNVVALM